MAIRTLTQLLTNGTITSNLIYEIVSGVGRCGGTVQEWEITCFTLMEILYDNVANVQKGELVGFCRAIGSALSDMYHSMNRYGRDKQDINTNDNSNGNRNCGTQKEMLKGFVVRSIKRTLGQIMKYLLMEQVPLKQYLPIHKILPSLNPQNKSNPCQPPTLTAPQKRTLSFQLEICLAFMNSVSQPSPNSSYMQNRRLLKQFQQNIITEMIKILPIVIGNVETAIEMHELERKISESLTIGQDKGTDKGESGAMLELDLPFALLEAIVCFPYVLSSRMFQTYPPKNAQQAEEQKKQRPTQYPTQITRTLCSKPFLQSLLTISHKLFHNAHNQLHKLSHNPLTPGSQAEIARLLTYLHYYRKVSGFVGQLAFTKVTGVGTVAVAVGLLDGEDDQFGGDGDEIDGDKFVGEFVEVIVSSFFKIQSVIRSTYQKQPTPQTHSQTWESLKPILHQLQHCNIHTLCRLISNLQLPALLSHPIPPSKDAGQFFDRLITSLCVAAVYQIGACENVTVSGMQDMGPTPARIVDEQVDRGTMGVLGQFFGVFGGLVDDMEEIGTKLGYEEFVGDQAMHQQAESKAAQYLAAAQQKMGIIITVFINRLATQFQSIYHDDHPGTGTYKISQQYVQILQLLSFIPTYMKKCHLSNLMSVMNAFCEKVAELHLSWSSMDRYCGEGGISQIVEVMENRIGNMVLIGKILLLENERFDQIASNQDESLQQTILLKQIQLIRQRIFAIAYTPSATHHTFLNDISNIGYMFGHVRCLLKKIKTKLQSYREKLLEVLYAEESDRIMVRVRHKREGMLARAKVREHSQRAMGMDMEADNSNNVKAVVNFQDIVDKQVFESLDQHLLAFMHIMNKKYLQFLKNFPLASTSTAAQQKFWSAIEICTQTFKMFSMISQHIKQVHYQYLSILRQYQVPFELHSKELLGKETYVETLVCSMLKEVKQAYLTQYNQYRPQSNLTQNPIPHSQSLTNKLQQYLHLYRMLVQILAYLNLHFERTQDIDKDVKDGGILHLMCKIELDDAFRYLANLNSNIKSRYSQRIDKGTVLEFGVVGLTGIFGSFARQSTSTSSMPVTFLTKIQTFIPVHTLMQMYIDSSPSSQPSTHKINRLTKILQLSYNILESLTESSNSGRAVKVRYQFIGHCLQFWTAMMLYMNLLHVNNGLQVQFRVLDKFEDLLAIIFAILGLLLGHNRSWEHGGVNFSLLRREYKDADVFLENFMRIFVIVHASREYNGQQEKGASLEYFPALNKKVSKCFTRVCISLLQFIFQFKTRQKHQPESTDHQVLVKQFTYTYIYRVCKLIEVIGGRVGKKSRGVSGKLSSKNEDNEAEIQQLEELLNMVKIVCSYIRRAILYEHNKLLQNNISLFLTQIHNKIIAMDGTKQTRWRQAPSSFNLQPKAGTPQQLALFYQLMRYGLLLAEQTNDTTYCLDHISAILVQLPGIFRYWNTITGINVEQNGDAWGIKVNKILGKDVGIQGEFLEYFMQIWQFCAINEKESYSQEKNQVMEWFGKCVHHRNSAGRKDGNGGNQFTFMNDFNKF